MADPKTTPSTAGADPPKPMPFAIMRTAHEALRASIRLQEQKLEAGDVAGFRDEWQTFQRAVAVHMAMEDDSMFELLDGVSGGAMTSADLPAEHVKDAILAAAVDAALGEGEANAQPPNVATRVFAWGLQHACSPSQWNRLRPIVQESCTAAVWAELTENFGLDADGPLA
jgi:hypothetical protein